MKSQVGLVFGLVAIGSAFLGYGYQIKHESCVVQIGRACLSSVEKAVTPVQQSKGLGERDGIGAQSGMIFYFNPPTQATFWMKGMRFPLDFIWVKNNHVAEVMEHVAAPPGSTPGQHPLGGAPLTGMTDDKLPRFQPKSPVDAVIEVNAGFVEYYKVKVGDEVQGL